MRSGGIPSWITLPGRRSGRPARHGSLPGASRHFTQQSHPARPLRTRQRRPRLAGHRPGRLGELNQQRDSFRRRLRRPLSGVLFAQCEDSTGHLTAIRSAMFAAGFIIGRGQRHAKSVARTRQTVSSTARDEHRGCWALASLRRVRTYRHRLGHTPVLYSHVPSRHAPYSLNGSQASPGSSSGKQSDVPPSVRQNERRH